MKDKTKEQIGNLIDYWKNKGWSCRTEVPTLYRDNSNGIKNLKANRIDVCCENSFENNSQKNNEKSIKCWEYEDGVQFQAVKNLRAGVQFMNSMKQNGYKNTEFCQLHPEEDFREVCKNEELNVVMEKPKLIERKVSKGFSIRQNQE